MIIRTRNPQLVVQSRYDVPRLDLATAYNRKQANPGSRLVEVREYDWSTLRFDLVGWLVSYPGDGTKYLTYADIERMHDERLALWARATGQTDEARKKKEEKAMTEKLTCPICGQEYTDEPALSRDNQTLICPDCGTRESLEAMGLGKAEQDAVIARIHYFNEGKKARKEGGA